MLLTIPYYHKRNGGCPAILEPSTAGNGPSTISDNKLSTLISRRVNYNLTKLIERVTEIVINTDL